MTVKPFRVMKGEPVVLQHLRYPLLALPKLNGFRGHVRDSAVLSASNTPLPNIHLQAFYRHFHFFDGEFLVGDPTDSKNSLNRTSSVVTSQDKPIEDLKFYTFDHTQDVLKPYRHRFGRLPTSLKAVGLKGADKGRVVVLESRLITCEAQLLDTEQEWVDAGYEGLITRDPEAPYKCGKSTAKQAWMGKMKRFADDEGVIIGFVEGEHNTNEATVSRTGHTKRSSAKAGKVPNGTLGAVIVRHKNGKTFGIGTGFTEAERDYIWAHREQYLGKLAKYKYFEIGSGDVPVLPVWLGLRDPIDL